MGKKKSKPSFHVVEESEKDDKKDDSDTSNTNTNTNNNTTKTTKPHAELLQYEPLHNFAQAMSHLGALQVQIVELTSQVEIKRRAQADFDKEKEAFKQEKKKEDKEADNKKKELLALKEQLSFTRALLKTRPRADNLNPLAIQSILSRIIAYSKLDRYDISRISIVSKHFLRACQEDLFKKSLSPCKLTNPPSCDNLVDILSRRAHLVELIKTVEFAFVPDNNMAPMDCLPRSMVLLLQLTKKATSISFSQMGARAVTPKILFPVHQTLEKLIVDPGDYRLTGLPVYASYERDRGIIACFPKLHTISLDHVELSISNFGPEFQCPIRSLTLRNTQIQGQLSRLCFHALRGGTLAELTLVSCHIPNIYDLFLVLNRAGPSLRTFTMKGCRFGWAREPPNTPHQSASSAGPLTLDAALAPCVHLTSLSLEIFNIPTENPVRFLDGLSSLRTIELEIDREVPPEDWLELFGCTSDKIDKLTIINVPWSTYQVSVLKERWKSRPGGIGHLEFLSRVPRRHSTFM